jgi:hypothetical protein
MFPELTGQQSEQVCETIESDATMALAS